MIGFLGLLVRTPLPISAFEASSGVASRDFQSPLSPSYNMQVDKGSLRENCSPFSLESFLTHQEAEGRAR